MKRIICTVMALILVLALCACGGDSLVSGDENLRKGYDRSEDIPVYDFLSEEHTTPENYEKYAEGAIDFGVKLLAENVQDGENVVLSPVSVSSVLALLANGAADKTRSEIRNVIASGADVDLINTGEYYLGRRLVAFNSEDGYFKNANSLWFNDTFDVKSPFLQTSANYYDVGVFRVDFTQEDTAEKINGWVSENTDGEIDKLLDEVEGDSAALVINTALLNDAWATPYSDTQISEGEFHGAKGDTQAEFMTSKEYYISTSYAEGFIKGFENVPCKFAALLPKDGQDITEFVQKLTGNRFTALLDSQSPMETCIVTLPQFSVESRLELADSLKLMGINGMFDASKADFSNLSNTGQVFVSKVTQDAFIEVGPQGAKAGAATVAEILYGSAQIPELPEKELTFDRPFVFVIFDNESNIPVFVGVVNNIE
ncbi:MAG: serpin family protein [Ruminococcus sp.]|nr:serpin family protein [Ruminococcus sp.]